MYPTVVGPPRQHQPGYALKLLTRVRTSPRAMAAVANPGVATMEVADGNTRDGLVAVYKLRTLESVGP